MSDPETSDPVPATGALAETRAEFLLQGRVTIALWLVSRVWQLAGCLPQSRMTLALQLLSLALSRQLVGRVALAWTRVGCLPQSRVTLAWQVESRVTFAATDRSWHLIVGRMSVFD